MRYKHFWVGLALLGWVVFTLRLHSFIYRVLPDQDEGHYTVIGYLWVPALRNPQILDTVHQFWEGRALHNRYYIDPSQHFPWAYIVYGLTQRWWGPSWLVGRYTGFVFGSLAILGLVVLASRLFHWRTATLLIWLVVFTPNFYITYSKAVAQPLAAMLLTWGFVLALPTRWRWPSVLSGVALALAMHTRVELWPLLPILLIYLWSMYRGARRGDALRLGGAWLVTTLVLHIITWPVIAYVWGRYASTFIPGLGNTPTWHFKPKPLSWASRWLALSDMGRKEPLFLWSALWLFATPWWKRRLHPDTEYNRWLRWLCASCSIFLLLLLVFWSRGAAAYFSYQTTFSPLFFLMLPLMFRTPQARRLAKLQHLFIISAFVIWSWQVGYSLHPLFFVRGQSVFKVAAAFFKYFLPPSLLLTYSFPPERVYEGLLGALSLTTAFASGWLMWKQMHKRFPWLRDYPPTSWALVAGAIALFIMTPLNGTNEDLSPELKNIFVLHAQRVSLLRTWLQDTFPKKPTLIFDSEPTLLVDVVDAFEWYPPLPYDTSEPDIWFLFQDQIPPQEDKYTLALRIPTFALGYPHNNSTWKHPVLETELWIHQRYVTKQP